MYEVNTAQCDGFHRQGETLVGMKMGPEIKAAAAAACEIRLLLSRFSPRVSVQEPHIPAWSIIQTCRARISPPTPPPGYNPPQGGNGDAEAPYLLVNMKPATETSDFVRH